MKKIILLILFLGAIGAYGFAVKNNVLPNSLHISFLETEVQEDGSVSKLYTSKAQELFNEISKELEK